MEKQVSSLEEYFQNFFNLYQKDKHILLSLSHSSHSEFNYKRKVTTKNNTEILFIVSIASSIYFKIFINYNKKNIEIFHIELENKDSEMKLKAHINDSIKEEHFPFIKEQFEKLYEEIEKKINNKKEEITKELNTFL